ncbi:MAG: hypothetical protein WBD01_04220 [Salaquimonas sp.]
MATTLLGGCTQTTGNIFAAKTPVQKQAISSVESSPKTDKVEVDHIKVAGISETAKKTARSNSAYKIDENSAWCEYLRNDAAANAEIIGSPTLSASTDDGGNGAFNIGMNLLDLKKAELVRQSGNARCQAHAAAKSIEITMRLVNEGTKFASDYAHYSYLAGKTGELNAIVKRANALKNAGVMTVQQANTIEKARADILAEMNTTKSEADKRKDLPGLDAAAITGSNYRLAQATQNIQTIDREIRTIEAFDISVQAGYRYNEDEPGDIGSDDYYAKIKLGVRIGALSKKRRQYEDAAAAARLNALEEENSGPLWQSQFAAGSIAKSLAGLRSARGNLTSALAASQDTANNLAATDRPELVYAGLVAKMDIISISGKLAAVQSSIKELESNQKKLSALAH